MATPVLNIPNEVLDLPTLKIVRAGVAAQKRLIAGRWAQYRKRWGGMVTDVEYCAIGSVLKPLPGEVNCFEQIYGKYDVDPITCAKIVRANDVELVEVTPEERQAAMLDWLDRCIAYAEGVKTNIEALARAEKTGTRVYVQTRSGQPVLIEEQAAA